MGGERANDRDPFRSARRDRQDFGMTRLESSGSDCPMGMSFRGKGVNPSNTDSDEDPMDQLRGHSITYRIAVGPQQGRKVFTLQTLSCSGKPNALW